MSSPWACSVCSSVWTKINKEVKQVATKAASNEARIDALESREHEGKEDFKGMKDTIKKLEERVNKVESDKSENSSEKMMEEIAERGSRERNVVCHSCPESETTEKQEAEDDDWAGVQGLFDHLGLKINASEALLGVRRLGKVKSVGSSRPLLIIFKHKSDRDALLEKAPKLSKDEDEYWKKISVVADLTLKQRELEKNMFRKAEMRNLQRSSDEQSKNLCHKVIGKRGERVLRVVELREREFINQEGKVVMMDQDQEGFRAAQSRDQLRGKKRSPSRSPGTSPPARRAGRRFGRGN